MRCNVVPIGDILIVNSPYDMFTDVCSSCGDVLLCYDLTDEQIPGPCGDDCCGDGRDGTLCHSCSGCGQKGCDR